VVQIRIQHQPATRAYVARHTTEGKTSREIQRCLARDVAVCSARRPRPCC
jgi:hypothetical protein